MFKDQNNYSKSSSDEMPLKEIILNVKEWTIYLLSKKRTIIIVGIIGGFMGLLAAFLIKPTYKAVLTFAMEDERGGGGSSGLTGALGLASSIGIDIGNVGGGGAFVSSNLSELMKSRLIVQKVLLKPIRINNRVISLADYYIEINKLRDKWQDRNELKRINFLPNSHSQKLSFLQDSIIQILYKSLTYKDNLNIYQKDKKVTILTLEVLSKNELFSKLFCENIAKETSDFYIETKSKKARINVNVLQKQVDSVRAELNGSIKGVATETDNVYNLNPALNIRSAPSKKKQIDVQANTAILTNLIVQLELAKITLRKETPLIQIIDTPLLPLEKEKLGKFKSLLFGSFLASFLTILFLVFNSSLKKIMS